LSTAVKVHPGEACHELPEIFTRRPHRALALTIRTKIGVQVDCFQKSVLQAELEAATEKRLRMQIVA